MIDGFETQSLQVGVASHEERESSSWSWEEDVKQPALDSCEGKNGLSRRETGPVPPPDNFRMPFLATRRQEVFLVRSQARQVLGIPGPMWWV